MNVKISEFFNYCLLKKVKNLSCCCTKGPICKLSSSLENITFGIVCLVVGGVTAIFKWKLLFSAGNAA